MSPAWRNAPETPDLLVAAAAAEAERFTALHYDQDFDKVEKVTGQTMPGAFAAVLIFMTSRSG